MIDLGDAFLDRGEGAVPDGLVRDQRKEAFHLIEPGSVGRDEVHVPARSAGEPRLDLGMAVRGVVVHDAVNIQPGGHRLVDFTQETQELLMPVTRFATGQHGAVEHVSAANSVVVP